MRIVDAHCHVSPVWYEPVESLLAQMDRIGVAQAVLIQILGNTDNGYLQRCAREHPERLVSVVAVDVTQPDACDTLAALAEGGAQGVRLRPDGRSPGSDPLAIWRTAAAKGLAVSCIGTADTFASPEFSKLLDTLPDLPIVLEHLGASGRVGATDLDARRRVFELARHPQVYLKVPGLGELVARPPTLPSEGDVLTADIPELDEALERFGPERLMWASDFPVVSSREGYGNALRWVSAALRPKLSASAQALVFGGNARRVFKLPDT